MPKMQPVLHGDDMHIQVSSALLISREGQSLHRWALISENISAVCLKPRSDFPDVKSIIEDMDEATWLVQRYDKPDIYLILSEGRVIGHRKACPPPLELADVAGLLDDLSDSRTPVGYTALPIWALAGVGTPDGLN